MQTPGKARFLSQAPVFGKLSQGLQHDLIPLAQAQSPLEIRVFVTEPRDSIKRRNGRTDRGTSTYVSQKTPPSYSALVWLGLVTDPSLSFDSG